MAVCCCALGRCYPVLSSGRFVFRPPREKVSYIYISSSRGRFYATAEEAVDEYVRLNREHARRIVCVVKWRGVLHDGTPLFFSREGEQFYYDRCSPFTPARLRL